MRGWRGRHRRVFVRGDDVRRCGGWVLGLGGGGRGWMCRRGVWRGRIGWIVRD